MKNQIYNFYNILIDNYFIKDNKTFFEFNNVDYIFMKVENDIVIVEKVYKYMLENRINVYEIILNKEENLFSKIDNNNFCLIKIKGLTNYIVSFDELVFYPIESDAIDWAKLWGEKLDYYEIQIRELAKNYQDVINSFGFFSGLAENAILYYNLTIKNFNDDKIVGIVHNRVMYPNYLINYLNPCEMIIDYNIRDIAEYIKSFVFSNDYNSSDILHALETLNLNKLMFNLLYSRLLYPTFYFDIFDNIILGTGEDKDIINVLNKIDDYLDLLKQIFIKFRSKYSLLDITWINKNVEN